MTPRSKGGRRSAARLGPVAVVLGVLVAMLEPHPTQADARSDYLVRLLQTSKTFRVRAQAALALGRVTEDPSVTQALIGALRDEHPAVRASAATSLGTLGDASALAALRGAERDSDSTVRAAASAAASAVEKLAKERAPAPPPPTPTPEPTFVPRYYVGVGTPGSAVALDARTMARARDYLISAVQNVDGVVLAPERETPTAARAVLKKRNLYGYFLDTSIVKIEPTGSGVRAVVSVIVGTYPGHEMRVILQGAATVEGSSGDSARGQAIEGALSGALRRLPQALSAAQSHDGG